MVLRLRARGALAPTSRARPQLTLTAEGAFHHGTTGRTGGSGTIRAVATRGWIIGCMLVLASSSCGFAVESGVAEREERTRLEQEEAAALEQAVNAREARIANERRALTATERRQERELARIQEAFGDEGIPVVDAPPPPPPVPVPLDAPAWCGDFGTFVFNGEQIFRAATLLEAQFWLEPMGPSLTRTASLLDGDLRSLLESELPDLVDGLDRAAAMTSLQGVRDQIIALTQSHGPSVMVPLATHAGQVCEGFEEVTVHLPDRFGLQD